MVKSVDSQRQRNDYGRMKYMSNSKMEGLPRDQWTSPWGDVAWLGTLYWLHTGKQYTFKEIAELTGWKWRTIKNKVNNLLRVSPLGEHIKEVKYMACEKKFYIDDPYILRLDFEVVARIVRGEPFKNSGVQLPNKCEKLLLKWLHELYPQQFIWGGGNISANNIGGKFPDIKHINQPILIEHYGTKYHGEEEEIPRIETFNQCGYHCLVIWEYELKNENKCKMKLKEYVDAIQNIQPVVI